MDNNYTVYKHTSPNGKVYIGITSQPTERRWRKGEGYIDNDYFYKAIQKYGWDNFKHEILIDGLSKEDACKKEIEIISKTNANNRKFGYNITKGGNAPKLSEETKEKLRKCHIGVKPNEETRKKMSLSQTGRKHSEETKAKMRLAQGGKNNPMYGKHHTKEVREKMSESHMGEKAYWYGKKRDKETVEKSVASHRKPVICVETEEIFPSVTTAAKAKNMSGKSQISNALNGRSQTAGGFHWEYYEECD